MNSAYLSPIAKHLWQSTLFAAFAGLLILLLRSNRARVRHWIWIAASWKFLVPFSFLISLGGHIHWRTPPRTEHPSLSVVVEVSQPFTASAPMSPTGVAPPQGASTIPELLWTIWACGFLGIGCSWWIRWRRIRAIVRAGSPVHLEIPIRVVSSAALLEPGVFGVFRPIMLLPEGIGNRLTAAQLKGVIAHELCQVDHWDNPMASIRFWIGPWSIKREFLAAMIFTWSGRRMKANCDLPMARGQTTPMRRPNLFAAMQEQLGLRLISTKAEVDVLVIDHAEKAFGELTGGCPCWFRLIEALA